MMVNGGQAIVTYWPPPKPGMFEEEAVLPICFPGYRRDGEQDEVVVSRDVKPGGFLFLGIAESADPEKVGARRIRDFVTIPDLRYLTPLRIAVLEESQYG